MFVAHRAAMGKRAAPVQARPAAASGKSSGVGQPAASKPIDKPKASRDPGDLQVISIGTSNLVREVVKWQKDHATRCIPNQHADDKEEAKLGERFKKLLLRRGKALGPEPSRKLLSVAEVELVNSVPGVPFKGCSVQGATTSDIAQSGRDNVINSDPPDSASAAISAVAQPAERIIQQQRRTTSGDNSAAEQPDVCSKPQSQPSSLSRSSSPTPSGGVPQPTAEKDSNVVHNNETKRKTLLLQLKRPHYNAIKDGRKLWEARPLFDGRWQPTIYDKLGVIGNDAVLQSGANTNDRVRIAEVRRYTPQGLSYPLQEMLAELGTDLLPDVADDRSRVAAYESLYGFGVNYGRPLVTFPNF